MVFGFGPDSGGRSWLRCYGAILSNIEPDSKQWLSAYRPSVQNYVRLCKGRRVIPSDHHRVVVQQPCSIHAAQVSITLDTQYQQTFIIPRYDDQRVSQSLPSEGCLMLSGIISEIENVYVRSKVIVMRL